MVTGREYLRVSLDKSGRARSVSEQHDDNGRAGELHGFALNGEAYSDVSISASRYTTKVRGGFAKLLADLEHGRFGADLLVLWESSRGSRRVGEWATLVDKLEDAGVRVHVTTHGRTYDPANPRDRRSLMEDAVDSEYESGRTSARVRRTAREAALRGEPHGRIPYGYTRTYDPRTRRLVSQDPHPDEAPVVRELFERLRKGHSLRSITRDFEARGIRTRPPRPCDEDCRREHEHVAPGTPGRVFSAQHLRDIALRPMYGGLRIHAPGNRAGRYQGSLDGAVKATWPALVDDETFYAVRNLLRSPERRTSRPGRGKHLLSLIAVCDLCGAWLTVRYRRGERQYFCRDRNCIRVLADDLDRHAERAMLGYLARDDVLAELHAGDGRNAELPVVRADLAAARAELTQLRKAGREGRLTVATVLEIEPGLVTRVADLERRERELAIPPALAVLMSPGKDVATRWVTAPMSTRREVARLLSLPRYLGPLRVGRSPVRGHRGEITGRVRGGWTPESLST